MISLGGKLEVNKSNCQTNSQFFFKIDETNKILRKIHTKLRKLMIKFGKNCLVQYYLRNFQMKVEVQRVKFEEKNLKKILKIFREGMGEISKKVRDNFLQNL